MYNPLCLETAPAKGVLAVAQQKTGQCPSGRAGAAAGQTLTPAPAQHSGTRFSNKMLELERLL